MNLNYTFINPKATFIYYDIWLAYLYIILKPQFENIIQIQQALFKRQILQPWD